MIYQPREYQELMIDYMLRNLRCNVFAGMGLGKTSSSIYAYDAMRMFGESERALVLAPKRVAKNTWPREIEKWAETFGHLKIAAAIGTEDERLSALRQNANITAINYDNVEWLMEVYGDHWPFDTVFADEASRLKGLRISLQHGRRKDGTQGKEFITGQGSVRAKALARVAHRKVRRWVNLTGSPAPNGLQDLWAVMWFVDRGQRLGNSFDGFEDRFFTKLPSDNGYGSRIVPLASSQQLIQDLIRDVCMTVDAKDWFDIKAPIERHIKVTLPGKARRMYDDMERQLFADVDGHAVEAFNAGGMVQKCLQLANGSVYTDTLTKEWVPVHEEKIEALRSIVEETNGEPLLVRYTHKPDMARILKTFPKAKFFDDSRATEDAWNRGEFPMLVTHAASAGHGSNLQDGGRILVDYSSGFNLEEDEQIIERIGPTRQMQSGHDRAVFRYRIVAEDTIEEHSVLPRIKTKANVQECLKAAMAMRRGATHSAASFLQHA